MGDRKSRHKCAILYNHRWRIHRGLSLRQFAVIALFCLGLSARAWSEAPSFDCTKASSQVEKAICASGDLSALDRQIAAEYATALSLGQITPAAQRAWLAKRNTVCAPGNSTDCLRQVLMERHAFLTQRPEGYESPPVRGHASFDCAKAESRTEKAVCGKQVLWELDVALMEAYVAALRENFFMLANGSEWPGKREKLCGDAPELEIADCLESVTKAEIRRVSFRATYSEGIGLYGIPYAFVDSSYHSVRAIDDASQRQSHARTFEDVDIFKASGAKIVGCDQVISLGTEIRGQEANIYGGLCNVHRGGRSSRELICDNPYRSSRMRYLDVGDRPINMKEIAIFTSVNCERNYF